VWNALEKLALRAPEVFVEYYANDLLALVAGAWLGPGYQMTSQVNVVNPGGKAQVGYTLRVRRDEPGDRARRAAARVASPVETGSGYFFSRHARSKGSRQAFGAISWWIALGPQLPCG